MAARHFLYLTNANLVSLVSRRGRIVGRKVFPATDVIPDEFERHVKGLRTVPTYLVTDLAEEEFRLDTIPHLGGRDRAAILGRKLAQLYRNTSYRHAITQGREPDGRRDDRVVYVAIAGGEVLRPWIEVLDRQRVPLEGIVSSAVFSGRLLAELRLQFAHTLLVTFTPGEALRQTYFRDKEIKFSRLTPVDLEEGRTLGEFLAEETTRTWQYLDSLRYFGAEDRLEVCLLVHPKDRPSVEPVLRDYDRIQYRILDIEQVAAKIGLKPPPLSSSAEEILAHLFLRRGAENHFASPELRRFATIRHARNAILAASGAVFAVGLAYGGWNLFNALLGKREDAKTVQQVAALNREYEDITRAMPTQGVGGPAMRDTVALYSGSLRDHPTVGAFLLPVSGVLARYPQVRLTQVAWQATDSDSVTPAIVPTIPRDAPPLKAVAKAAANAPRPGQVKADPSLFSAGRHAVAVLEATVTIDRLDFREALSQVERVVADIAKIPGYQARMLDSPLDISPHAAISGRLGERDPGHSQARFSIRVSRQTVARP